MPWNPETYEATLVQTLDEVLDLREWLGERRDWLGVDIETSGFNLGRDQIRLFQLGDAEKGWAIPWEDWAGFIKEIMPQQRQRLVFHNAPFDIAFLLREGVRVRQELTHCTMVMSHLENPRRAIGLKPRAARHVHPAAMMGRDALDKAMKAGGWGWDTVPIDLPEYWGYGAMDTSLTAALAEKLYPVIQPYLPVYEIEMASVFVLRDARLRGLLVDTDLAAYRRASLLSDIERLDGRLPFEPTKDHQVKEWLTDRGRERGYGYALKDWWPFRTDTGEVSLDDKALQAFTEHFPDIMPMLREHRMKAKLVSSYFNNMLAHNVDGVLRCNIKQVGARTARMSITEPALQQLPRGPVVRDCFIPREGCKILLADYSQMEARMFAADARCTPMLEAFERGEDLHRWTAGVVYHGDDTGLVEDFERQISKNVGYAKLYGAGDEQIAKTAGVPVTEISDFQRRYDEAFPEVATYMQGMLDKMAHRLRKDGDAWVETILGRRLPVDSDKLYAAVNYRIQGSGGDVLKKKIVELDNAGLGEYIRLPVHDEIFFEVPDEEVDDVLPVVREVMPETDLFSCPLTIETDVVEKWGDHYRDDDERGHWVEGEGWRDAV